VYQECISKPKRRVNSYKNCEAVVHMKENGVTFFENRSSFIAWEKSCSSVDFAVALLRLLRFLVQDLTFTVRSKYNSTVPVPVPSISISFYYSELTHCCVSIFVWGAVVRRSCSWSYTRSLSLTLRHSRQSHSSFSSLSTFSRSTRYFVASNVTTMIRLRL